MEVLHEVQASVQLFRWDFCIGNHKLPHPQQSESASSCKRCTDFHCTRMAAVWTHGSFRRSPPTADGSIYEQITMKQEGVPRVSATTDTLGTGRRVKAKTQMRGILL